MSVLTSWWGRARVGENCQPMLSTRQPFGSPRDTNPELQLIAISSMTRSSYSPDSDHLGICFTSMNISTTKVYLGLCTLTSSLTLLCLGDLHHGLHYLAFEIHLSNHETHLVTIGLSHLCEGPQHVIVKCEEGLGASFIFGDSLVDAGNNNFLSTLSKANIRPNGIDFKANGGKPNGRFTNGRTIGDIVGELLGQPNYALPFLDPNCKGKAILTGVNYASGGAGIMNQTGRIFVNRVSMDIQVDFFNTTRSELDGVLGASKAKEYLMKKSMFSVTVGSNDFLNNYLLPVLSIPERISENPGTFIDNLINSLRGQLTRLYKLDARKFVIGNVGPLGCIPYQKQINGVNKDECVALPNKLALQYNGRLKDLLKELNTNLPGSIFVHANVYDLVLDLMTNYAKYGFKTASIACCGNGGQYQGIIPCGPASSMCEDRSKYVFWDPYHPSEAANVIIARKLVDGGINDISPVNLRKLKDM